MKFYKFISVVLHPIVVPTLGVLLYFMLVPIQIESNQKLAILGLIFIATYFIPLLLLVILKTTKLIKSYKVHSIKERKIPLFLLIFLYYTLGNTLFNIRLVRELGILFYACSLGLIVVYLLFTLKFKTSLHLFSPGMSIGFFLLLSTQYFISFLPIILILIVLSGFLGSARLHLKAHTPREIYIGFFLGLICPFVVNAIL